MCDSTKTSKIENIKTTMSLIKAAAGDAALTFLWVFNLPIVGLLTKILTTSLGIQPMSLASIFMSTITATINVMLFSNIAQIFGGANFNPATSVAFYAAGLNPALSLTSMAINFPVQAAASAVGAMLVLQVMPGQFKDMPKGPSLKVDLHAGAMAEGIVTFLFNLALLVIFIRGPKSLLLKFWFVAVVTMVLVIGGSGYSGPSLNPANAFGWTYVNNWCITWEHFYVYWICPFVGAILAAWVFKAIFPPSAQKQKKA